MQLSPNFSFEEMTNSSSYPELVDQNRSEALEYQHHGEKLCKKILQVIRDMTGEPVSVGSGSRGPTLNGKVGGSANSQHQSFQAADINLKGLASADGRLIFLGIIWGLELAEEIRFGQLLIERGCIHVSLPRGNGRDGEIAYYDVASRDKIIIREGK